MKKITWLDKFAEDRSTMTKKTACQIILNRSEFKDAVNGETVTYKNKPYKVIKANFEDEIGDGILLEEIELEDISDQMDSQMGIGYIENTVTAPERAVNPVIEEEGFDVQTVEVDKFVEEAIETEIQVSQENAIDGTTPEGKINRILNRLNLTETIEEDVETCEEFVDENLDGACDLCEETEELHQDNEEVTEAAEEVTEAAEETEEVIAEEVSEESTEVVATTNRILNRINKVK